MTIATNTAAAPATCPYCGAYAHLGMCPRVRRIEYHENGTVKAVDLVAPEVGVTVKAEALALAAKLRMAVETLQAIAKSDYRGNVPHEVTMARIALRDLDGEGAPFAPRAWKPGDKLPIDHME